MKTYTFVLVDGGADGVPAFSETVQVSIEADETHDRETVDEFLSMVADSMKIAFGVNLPRVHAKGEDFERVYNGYIRQ